MNASNVEDMKLPSMRRAKLLIFPPRPAVARILRRSKIPYDLNIG